jgi:hypothetical protein
MRVRSRLSTFLLLLGIVTVSTWAQTKKPPEVKANGGTDFLPDANPQYFPKEVFGDSKKDPMKDFSALWYAAHLRAMHEPSLLQTPKDKSAVVYRFLWLRTFHHPIVIRLNIRPDGTGFLTGKATNRTGGYDPGKLTWNESREMSQKDVQKFLTLLNKAEFWKLPAEISEGGNDGAEWIMEGLEKGSYHVTDRWSPSNTDYSAMCLFLLNFVRNSDRDQRHLLADFEIGRKCGTA